MDSASRPLRARLSSNRAVARASKAVSHAAPTKTTSLMKPESARSNAMVVDRHVTGVYPQAGSVTDTGSGVGKGMAIPLLKLLASWNIASPARSHYTSHPL